MGDADIFHDGQVTRFMDAVFPSSIIAQHTNPILSKLPQFVEFGSGNGCTPQHFGMALRNSLADTNAPDLLEHAAHAKKWLDDALIQYIDGELPVWLRAPKFAVDAVKALQWAARVIATVKFLIQLLQQEIEEANHFINRSMALVQFAQSTISPEGLRTAAERDLVTIFAQAVTDLQQQQQQNQQTLQCLI
ncbi:MAG: hypothetical protein ACREDR_00530 [Blastocatellia bacterium]